MVLGVYKCFKIHFKVITSIVVISNMSKTKLHSLEKRLSVFCRRKECLSSEVKFHQRLNKMYAEVATSKSEDCLDEYYTADFYHWTITT
jgi:hypothetical protein